MKKILAIFLCLVIFGCAKKELKIPTLSEKGVQEVHNHSQVWIFMNIKNGDTIADVNRKNTISTTHWIYNIDKHLPLKTFIQNIGELQNKHAHSIHSKDGMHDYYSYSDTISKKLSFLAFDKVTYKTDSLLSKYYIKKYSTDYTSYFNINLMFNPHNVWLNDAKLEKEEFRKTLQEFIDFASEDKQTMLHLNFNQQMLYGDYLFYKTMIHNFNNPAILVSPFEFVFDPKKVPDCGCE